MSVAADVARGASTVVVVAVGSTTYAIDGQEVPELGKDTAFDALEAAGVYRLLDRAWVRASGGAADAAAPRTPDSVAMGDSLVKPGVPAVRLGAGAPVARRSAAERMGALPVPGSRVLLAAGLALTRARI